MGLVVTAGLSLFGLTFSLLLICVSVLTPISFPNTGAVILVTTRTLFGAAFLGTLPVYAHNPPPQPYFMLPEEIGRLPFRIVTCGDLAFPPRPKFSGPYISEPEPTIDIPPGDTLILPFE